MKEKEKRRDMFRRDRERKEREGATIEELREIEMEEEMKEKKIVEDARERREYELSEERQRVGGAKGPTVKNLTSQQLHELLLEDLKKYETVADFFSLTLNTMTPRYIYLSLFFTTFLTSISPD